MIACIVTKLSSHAFIKFQDKYVLWGPEYRFSVEGKVFESFAPWPSSPIQVHNVDNITVQKAEVMQIKQIKAKHKN